MKKHIDIGDEFCGRENKEIRPGMSARFFNFAVIGPRSHAVHERI